MSKRSESKPRIAAEAIENNLVFSNREVWAMYTMPQSPYEYQKNDQRIEEADTINQIYSALMRNNDSKPLELAIWVTPKPYDVSEWLNQWDNRVNSWGAAAPGYPEYSLEMAGHISMREFYVPETTIAILLGNRGAGMGGDNPYEKFKATVNTMWESLKTVTDKTLLLTDPEPTLDERTYYAKRAESHLADMISAEENIKPATPEGIAYLIKSTFFPAMHTPEVTSDPHESWGRGEIYSLANSRVTNNSKHLKIEQEDQQGGTMEGYKSTLAFTRFPNTMFFPHQSPWIYVMHAMGVNSFFYGRFTLSPRTKVQKDISKKVKSTEDEMINASSAGGVAPRALQEQYQNAKNLEHSTSQGDDPWIYGRWRIVVNAPTLDILETDVKKIITSYARQQIDVTRPTGDQLNLLFESHPGDKVRLTSYMQYHALDILGGGMPTADSAVGDRLSPKGKGWFGPYLGYTTSGIIQPVHLSPHVPIDHNRAGGVLITGAPGGGKTFAAFTMTCQMAMQGVWCVYIDPKNDAVRLAGLQGIGKVNIFDLGSADAAGMLDPFRMKGSIAAQSDIAIEIVSLLLGDLDKEDQNALTTAALYIRQQTNPSMNMFMRYLLEQEDGASKALGNRLLLVSGLDYANLCFGEGGKSSISPQDSMTIITLLGLEIPDVETRKEDYTRAQRLAVTILYLVSSFTLGLMQSLDKYHPKAIIIDEAWAITSTPQGAAMIPKIARLGRSLNTALLLVSQNAGDFQGTGTSTSDGASYANSMTMRLAFRTSNKIESNNVVNLLDLNRSGSIVADLMDLDDGECIVKDHTGRTARMQVDAWNPEWNRAFETNPDEAAADSLNSDNAAYVS